MSETKKLIESIQFNLNESVSNELVKAVNKVFGKTYNKGENSILIKYNGTDLWITDVGDRLKLGTTRNSNAVLHDTKGPITDIKLNLEEPITNGYISCLRRLKLKYDDATTAEDNYKVHIVNSDTEEDGYLSNDNTITSKENARIFKSESEARNSLVQYLSDNKNSKGEIE